MNLYVNIWDWLFNLQLRRMPEHFSADLLQQQALRSPLIHPSYPGHEDSMPVHPIGRPKIVNPFKKILHSRSPFWEEIPRQASTEYWMVGFPRSSKSFKGHWPHAHAVVSVWVRTSGVSAQKPACDWQYSQALASWLLNNGRFGIMF